MIKSLGKIWILTTFPLVLARLGLGALVLTVTFTLTCTTDAQTRTSASSTPYTYSEQSNSTKNRPNPIRLVQAELEIPLLAYDQEDDPFGPVDDLDLDTGLNESYEPYEPVLQDQARHLDIPENFPNATEFESGFEGFFQDDETEEEFELPSLQGSLPVLQQNTDTNQLQRPTFSPPQDVSLEETFGERHAEEEEIRRRLREMGQFGPVEPSLPPVVPPRGTQQPALPVEPVEPTYPPRPETDGPATSMPEFGKRQPTAAKRYFQDCNIGRDMMFADQYGAPIEITPFLGFFVENPHAPLFDFGGSGLDFFGYPRDCPPVRPCGWLFDNMEIFFGTSGFGLRSDDIEETSFGIHEGINWSGSLSPRFGLGAQFGVRAVQRTIDGTNPLLVETEKKSGKSQVFITTGFFKRAQCHPFQYGVVYDWMSDNVYRNRRMENGKILDAFNLGQVRTELSYKHCSGFTWGVRGAFGMTQTDIFEQAALRTKATTQIHGFFEKPFWCGSLAGFSAGGTPKGNAVLSAYYDQPLRDKFSLKAGFTYMLPKDNNKFVDERNAWEAMISLTFHPHGGAFSKNCNPLRAMFDVAGNGSMIVSHRK